LDQGLSGFTSENRKKGALGLFLRAVETGLVPEGSFLLVESLDRLSRDKVLEQVGLLTTLVNAGITVVTLNDRQVLNKQAINKDPMLLMIALVGMLRANEESETKSDRVRNAWAQKRRLAREKKLSAVCPKWLKLSDDRKSFEVITDRAEIVRRIFEMNAIGVGQLTIARTFNEENISVWGGGQGWHASYLQKILHSRAVLGEFQPCYGNGTERIPDGEPISDYFPPIVDVELWQRVQRPGRPLPPGRTGNHLSNLFGGLIFDGYTGNSMRHLSRRSGSKKYESSKRLYYLVSDYARLGLANKQTATSWRYDWFEALFLDFIVRLDWSAIAQEATPVEEARTRTELAAQQAKIEDYQRQIKRLGDVLATTDQAAPQSILARISKLEKAMSEASDELVTIAKQAAIFEAQRMVMRESGDKIKAFVKAGDHESRLRLREEIRRKIVRIDVFANGVPEKLMADLPFTAPGRPTFKITFANQAFQWVFNDSKKPTANPILLEIGDDQEVIDANLKAPRE
jgi:DNA invertase Pin-like site-specific DNA recombinase